MTEALISIAKCFGSIQRGKINPTMYLKCHLRKKKKTALKVFTENKRPVKEESKANVCVRAEYGLV